MIGIMQSDLARIPPYGPFTHVSAPSHKHITVGADCRPPHCATALVHGSWIDIPKSPDDPTSVSDQHLRLADGSQDKKYGVPQVQDEVPREELACL
jgi:hypothetical protein